MRELPKITVQENVLKDNLIMVLLLFLTLNSLFQLARVKKLCVMNRYVFRRKNFFSLSTFFLKAKVLYSMSILGIHLQTRRRQHIETFSDFFLNLKSSSKNINKRRNSF
jgi:hypothetical protein